MGEVLEKKDSIGGRSGEERSRREGFGGERSDGGWSVGGKRGHRRGLQETRGWGRSGVGTCGRRGGFGGGRGRGAGDDFIF